MPGELGRQPVEFSVMTTPYELFGTKLAHAQATLAMLRAEVDNRLASVVHQDVQGEGVQMDLPFDAPDLSSPLRSVRCWPEIGWPNQVSEPMKPAPVDPTDPKNKAPGKAQS